MHTLMPYINAVWFFLALLAYIRSDAVEACCCLSTPLFEKFRAGGRQAVKRVGRGAEVSRRKGSFIDADIAYDSGWEGVSSGHQQ